MMRVWGWKPQLPDRRDFLYAVHPEYMDTPPLPCKVDLRPLMSPIEDQGQLGSCTAHATCANLEFLELQEIKKNLIAPENFGPVFQRISRLFVYYNSRALEGNIGSDSGATLRDVIRAIRSQGICRESLWPYDEHQVFNTPIASTYAEGLKHKVLFGYSIDNTNLVALKQCLANGFPYIFGISVYRSFMSEGVATSGLVPIPQMDEDCLGGHALCCVGYDDSMGGHFIFRNSWGTSWGLEGYGLIPYSYLTNPGLAADFWTLRKTGPNS